MNLYWAIFLVAVGCVGGQMPQNGPTYQCPPRQEINPCVCVVKKNGLDILCEFTDFFHINKAMAVIKGKSNIVVYYLKLRHNNLPKLQSFIFLGIDIRHLTIHNSSLAVVEESSLSSMGIGLTQLDLSQNSLGTVPSPAFRNLHHLLILNLNHNKITQIHAKAFEGLDTLEILTLYGNKITLIEDQAFKGLTKKMRRLNVGGNELTSIPKAVGHLENLRKLEMQENSITQISEADFEGLVNLDSLGLAHNHLRTVPARAFSHLRLLNSLELDGNLITHIDPDAFVGLEENLQYLRLGDNNIHVIPSDALRRVHRLRHLDLRANNITYISDDAFAGFGDSITFLNLQKNSIKTLPSLGFDNLNSLETLNLQNNKLVHIPEEIMEPIVDTLRVVDIMDNPLVCDCELRWYRDWLKNLKDKDDEMMQKKRTVCTMVQEHREYPVQNMPLDKMNCVGKNMERISNSLGVKLQMTFFVLATPAFVIYH
ncbi:protein slit [Cimex lectularius]|uniref:LRRCT domain-containing protein n=1 Tax=Cimex lectularius TaxID=79782 RepID=A0A8I6RQP1_CIMLE|nr:protein slit [Cimex lectularius]XP_014246410.1 protein slit [Cimex lectularius]